MSGLLSAFNLLHLKPSIALESQFLCTISFLNLNLIYHKKYHVLAESVSMAQHNFVSRQIGPIFQTFDREIFIYTCSVGSSTSDYFTTVTTSTDYSK